MTDGIDVRVSELAERQHGVFTTGQLARLGVPEHARKYRLRARRWAQVYEGVYRFAGTPLTWRGRVLAACWAAGDLASASGRAAGKLWRLPGGSDEVVEITCRRWRRARHDGLLVHESLAFDDVDVTVTDGMPVTNVARTLFDLARVCGDGTIDLAIDDALRRRLTTEAELEAIRDRLARSGREGSARFRSVLAGRTSGATESTAERRLLQLLRRHGLPAPVPQHQIRDAGGRLVARVDLAYPDLRIAIEYDSYAHHMGTAAHERDAARRNGILAADWYLLVATAADLRDGGHRLAAEVRRAHVARSGVTRGE